MKKYSVLLILITALVSILNLKAYAEDSSIVIYIKPSGNIEQSILIIDDGYLFPGEKIEKNFSLKNNCPFSVYIDRITAKNIVVRDKQGDILSSSSNEYKSFIKYIRLKLSDGNAVLFDNNFEQLLNNGEITADIRLSPQQVKYMKITAYMDSQCDSNAESLICTFKLGMRVNQMLGSGGNSNSKESEVMEESKIEEESTEDNKDDISEIQEENPGVLPVTGGLFTEEILLLPSLIMIIFGIKILNKENKKS